jgi:hypothetical protein
MSRTRRDRCHHIDGRPQRMVTAQLLRDFGAHPTSPIPAALHAHNPIARLDRIMVSSESGSASRAHRSATARTAFRSPRRLGGGRDRSFKHRSSVPAKAGTQLLFSCCCSAPRPPGRSARSPSPVSSIAPPMPAPAPAWGFRPSPRQPRRCQAPVAGTRARWPHIGVARPRNRMAGLGRAAIQLPCRAKSWGLGPPFQ